MCLTGGEDGNVRLWDLRRVDADNADGWGEEEEGEIVTLSDVAEEQEEGEDHPPREELVNPSAVRGKPGLTERDDSCARVLEGHTKAVTALYFEGDCLVCTFPALFPPYVHRFPKIR